MKKSPQPSPTQLEVIRKLIEHGGRLKRLAGGFWTYPDCPPGKFEGPEWSASTNTVHAMEKRGWLRRAEEVVETWRDDRLLTDTARALVIAEAVINSKDIAWTFDREMFRFMAAVFDVDAAKLFLVQRPRDAQRFDISQLGGIVATYVHIKEDSLEKADLDMPIILALVEGAPFPIDGWHRIAKAGRGGRTWLHGFLLTERESATVRR